MATIKLRGSQATPLTIAEVDANFSNLNNDKYEKTGGTISGDVAITGTLGLSYAATVTAGSNAQGQGALTKQVNVITTTSANPSGVTLPSATVGVQIVVVNDGTNPINVYPASGDHIDALSVNASIQIPVGGKLTFHTVDTTTWASSSTESVNSTSLTNTNATGLSVLQTGYGAGFQYALQINAGTTSWSVPSGVKRFKATIVGGGGSGAGTAATIGHVGGGGGSGAVGVAFFDIVGSTLSGTCAVGAAGAAPALGVAGNAGGATTFTYNGVTITANAGSGGVLIGAGGAGGSAPAIGTNIKVALPGMQGHAGGVQAATTTLLGIGGSVGLGYGFGGQATTAAAGSAGNTGTGYGAGGSGGASGSAATGRAGGAGTAGVIILEW